MCRYKTDMYTQGTGPSGCHKVGVQLLLSVISVFYFRAVGAKGFGVSVQRF